MCKKLVQSAALRSAKQTLPTRLECEPWGLYGSAASDYSCFPKRPPHRPKSWPRAEWRTISLLGRGPPGPGHGPGQAADSTATAATAAAAVLRLRHGLRCAAAPRGSLLVQRPGPAAGPASRPQRADARTLKKKVNSLAKSAVYSFAAENHEVASEIPGCSPISAATRIHRCGDARCAECLLASSVGPHPPKSRPFRKFAPFSFRCKKKKKKNPPPPFSLYSLLGLESGGRLLSSSFLRKPRRGLLPGLPTRTGWQAASTGIHWRPATVAPLESGGRLLLRLVATGGYAAAAQPERAAGGIARLRLYENELA